jgi:hypothetical protein
MDRHLFVMFNNNSNNFCMALRPYTDNNAAINKRILNVVFVNMLFLRSFVEVT